MDTRKQKGYQIAKTKQIVRKPRGWMVPSQSSNKTYFVDEEFVCDCPDSVFHKATCKHAFAVRYSIKAIVETTQGAVVKEKRLTYPQAWAIYDKCQQTEKQRFMELLQDLLKEVDEPIQINGRPHISIRDNIFASALKVYSQFSLRRFMTDLETAREKGFVSSKPCFASVGHFIQRESLTPLLSQLIQITALPLRSVEDKFAVDSSGFRTTKFNEYCKEAHDTKQKHEWIKCHIICGVKTNIITAVEVGLEHHSADSPQFIPLVNATHNAGFIMNEVSGDKAYSSIANYNAVRELGGQAYIPFRNNTTGMSKGNKARLWRRMFWYFQLKQEDFMKHYHLRSNVESTFFMIKAKFNDNLKSKSRTAQINELLLKILCHNICVLIQESYELGIEPNFLRDA
jgi:transposase